MADCPLRSAYQNGTSEDGRNFLYGLPASIYDLPSKDCRFFGRLEELERLKRALNDSEIYHCCLYGLPGVGKSRLAIEFAHEARNKEDWRVLFIDVKDITENAELESEIHRVVLQECKPTVFAAGMPQLGRVEIQRMFAEAVRDAQRLLLVLDSCDRILANKVEHLLFVSMLRKMVAAGRRDLTIATTSCSWYGLRCKEQLNMPVKPLDTAASNAFLKSWYPQLEDVEQFSEICGGLPLYLETVGSILKNYVTVGILCSDELLKYMQEDLIATLDEYMEFSKPSESFERLFQNMGESLVKSFWCLSLFQRDFSKVEGAHILDIAERKFAGVLIRLFDFALVDINLSEESRQNPIIHPVIRAFAVQEAKKNKCQRFKRSQQLLKEPCH